MYRDGHLIEFALLVTELCIWGYLLYRLIGVYKSFRMLRRIGMSVRKSIKQSFLQTFHTSRVYYFAVSEVLIWYYALFSWKNNPKPQNSESMFTFHKGSIYFGLYIAFLHEQFFEGVALHFWISTVNPVLAWVCSGLHFYSMIWLVGDYNAIRFSRIVVDTDSLRVHVGLRRKVVVPLCSIEAFLTVDPSQNVKKSKDIFVVAILQSLKMKDGLTDAPQFELQLRNPANSTTFFGRTRPVSRIFIRADNPIAFSTTLRDRLSMCDTRM